jgi:hypothetical protein
LLNQLLGLGLVGFFGAFFRDDGMLSYNNEQPIMPMKDVLLPISTSQ